MAQRGGRIRRANSVWRELDRASLVTQLPEGMTRKIGDPKARSESTEQTYYRRMLERQGTFREVLGGTDEAALAKRKVSGPVKFATPEMLKQAGRPALKVVRGKDVR